MSRTYGFLVCGLMMCLLSFSWESRCYGAERKVTEIADALAGYVINNFNFYAIRPMSRPPKGRVFLDPTFHTTITRITEATKEAHGQKYDYAFPGYPKHDIENSDGTRLLIQTFGGSTWSIWNAKPPYDKIKDIPPTVVRWGLPLDARWDSVNPRILYFGMDGKFLKYDVVTDEVAVLYNFAKDFPPREGGAYPLCGPTMKEEGTPSDDSRYWAFIIQCHDPAHSPQWWDTAFVVFDKDYTGKDQGKIIAQLRETQPLWPGGAGFISMTASGKYVWIGDAHKVYSRDFTWMRTPSLTWGHADVAMSVEGREVLFGFAFKEGQYWAAMWDIESQQTTFLHEIGAPRYHFSGNALNGWGVVSTYYPEYPQKPATWGDHEVFMVELTTRKDPAPRVWRLAHTHTVFKGYPDAPFAKINRRGTKIWFGSGWDQSYVDGQYDVYQIDLPDAWLKKIARKDHPGSSSSEK